MGTDPEGVAAAGLVTLGDGRTAKPTLVAGVLTAHASAFAGSRLFAPCGAAVLAYSARTAKQIGVLTGHKGQVTAVCAGPSRSDCALPLATGTALGEVRLWDSKGLACLGCVDFDSPIYALRWPSEGMLVVELGPVSEKEKARVERIDVVSMSAPKRGAAYSLSADCAGPFDAVGDAVALADGSDLTVCLEGRTQPRRYPHKDRITAVAIDPHRRYIAVGDEKGVVWTWWGILDSAGDDSQRVPARWHWHAHPVRALAHCGPVLLTGGDEGVLCIRNMDEESIHFVPRFPASLRHITSSANGKHLALSLEENSLALIDGLHGWVRPRLIHGLDVPVTKLGRRAGSAALHVLPDGSLATTGGGRRVQFLDDTGRILASKTLELDRGGCTAANDPMQRWVLRQLAFGSGGKCLMTVETRRSPALQRFDEDGMWSCVIKWWRCGEDGKYVLDSVAHDAHEADVTVALAHPHKDTVFVTASLDGTFKSWDYLQVSDTAVSRPSSGSGAVAGALPTSAPVAGASHCWQCIAMGSWHARPVLSGCFSADGSTLVLGFHGFAVLWEHDTASELRALMVAEPVDRVIQMCSAMACGRFLLLASIQGKSCHEVVCWDLVTLECAARIDLGALRKAKRAERGCQIRVVAPPHGSGALRLMAFEQRTKTLKVWRLAPGATAEEPLAVKEEASMCMPTDRSVLDAAFAPDVLSSDQAPLRILAWTSAFELWDLNLSKKGKVDAGQEAEHQEQEEEEASAKSKLARVLGTDASGTVARAAASDVQVLELEVRSTPAQQAGLVPHLVERIAPGHVPSHMLPATPALWASFLAVYAKPPPGGAAAAGAEDPDGVQKQSGGQLALPPPESDAWEAPSWLRPEDRGNLSEKSEFVDADWMDELVSKASKKGG